MKEDAIWHYFVIHNCVANMHILQMYVVMRWYTTLNGL